MADDSEILIEFCKYCWAQSKQSEDQRATLTNIILGVASAVIALIVQKGLTNDSLLLAFLLIVLGIYGAIASEKLYERHQMYSERASFYREKIDNLHPNAKINSGIESSKVKHEVKFKRLSKMRLHYLWLTLHLLIVSVGVILSVIIIST